MALSDPFQTTYEGAYKGASSLGENILGIAGLYAQQKQKEKLLEQEYQLKQKYPDPFMAMMAKQFGLTLPGQETTGGGDIQMPAKSIKEAEDRLKREDKDPRDYKIKEQKTIIGKMPVTTFTAEELPKKTMNSQQEQALQGSIGALSNLKAIKQLRQSSNVETGITSLAGMPFGQRLSRMGIGEQPTRDLGMLQRQLQSNYVTSQTGAQRGFPEIQYLTIALPGLEMPGKDYDASVDTAINNMERNVYNLISHAKKTRREIGEYEDILPELEAKYKGVGGLDVKTKLQRAEEIAKQNPNLNKQQIIEMVNKEFGK